jgi:hypothetical protein
MSDTRDARIAQLRDAAVRKREDATAKASRAIIALENRGRAVNFTTVASEAGVSKDFLYKNEALRSTIMGKRGPSTGSPSRSRSPSPASSDAVKLRVATDALKRLRAENDALRTESARLRGDLHDLRRRRPLSP